MAKRSWAPELRQTPPALDEINDIVDAPVPIPVQFRINYRIPFNHRDDDIVDGFAIAWTKNAGLVVWREGDIAITAWLPAADIRRRR